LEAVDEGSRCLGKIDRGQLAATHEVSRKAFSVYYQQEVTWLWGDCAPAMADEMLIPIEGKFEWSQ